MDIWNRRRHVAKTGGKNLTQNELKKHVFYNPVNGKFSWRKTRSGRKENCGYLAKDGYRQLMISGRLYQEHRLAWLFVYGALPPSRMMDHINRDRSDNRISNLRLCTESQNCHNRKIPSTNTSGFKGIRFKKNRWEVSCMVEGKREYLGRYVDREDAVNVYNSYVKELLGEFATLTKGEYHEES